ncbi:MAG: hypothetical protein LC099_09685 [Anaerolineales bacterium]|nr:hypothetical protein [Anaerolineales bacterium]
MKKITYFFSLLVVGILVLSACNLPTNNPQAGTATSAAQTVEAFLSATATETEMPATGTPEATFTPPPTDTATPAFTATPVCPQAQFITDVTIPDGTVMTPGQTFTKKWRIRNTGQCAWSGYSLVFDTGDSMGGPASQAIGSINPGQEFDLEVNLTAPTAPGSYRGYWRIVTNSSVLVPILNGYQGRAFYVDVKVQAPVTATPTNAPFAVTSVTFTNTGGCNGFTTTASITVNGPGTVNFHWIRSDGATSAPPPPLVFTAAGTKTVSESWTTTVSGTHGFDIYIDSPNHQQFGSATFTCP